MEVEISFSEALDRDKALVLAAVAARKWCQRSATDAPTGAELQRCLMEAAAWTSRARRHHGLEPMGLDDLRRSFISLTSEWLPGAGYFALVEDGLPTAICQDYADEAGGTPLLEVEQGIIRMVMSNLSARSDADDSYTAFRRFLVTHAYALHTEAAQAIVQTGVELSRFYGPVSSDAVTSYAGKEVFYPCPRCRWPMAIRADIVSCERSPTCIQDGARFRLQEGALVALGRRKAPAPVLRDGHAALRMGIWRYTVLPGLAELDLEARLQALPGVQVALWPYLDAYDLDVRAGDHHWRVDVKDHVSPIRLGKHLKDNPASNLTWIVVPDERRDQVAILSRFVPESAQYRFASSSEFVRRVKGAL